jgi:hypothetical protein
LHRHRSGHHELKLPINEEHGLVGYEIDKRMARLVHGEEIEQKGWSMDDIFQSTMNMSVA